MSSKQVQFQNTQILGFMSICNHDYMGFWPTASMSSQYSHSALKLNTENWKHSKARRTRCEVVQAWLINTVIRTSGSTQFHLV